MGDDGDQNTDCIYESAISVATTPTPNLNCALDADCRVWEVCELPSATCVKVTKSCPEQCYASLGQGECTFVNTNTDSVVSECYVGDVTCDAVCECTAGFSGESCSYTTEQLEENQAIREQLIYTLQSVTVNEDATTDSVTSWISTLEAITQNPTEISSTTSPVILDVVDNILNGANSAALSSTDISSLFTSIDVTVSSSAPTSNRRRHRNLQESAEHNRTNYLLDGVSSIIVQDTVVGEAAFVSIQSSFRVSILPIEADDSVGVSLTGPLSSLERLSGLEPTCPFRGPFLRLCSYYTFSFCITL